ncbi:endonuclease/exonuclease/phosphatase family protein [Kibdelosporangium philippinense]|uniref:Endonuclease/exonuclease/phosphatase family protein n=1 Tax=Kibdelosporangium philippinense TaxID=211113 RepID=A0ABS8Z4S5_9PSEU|nr:endonuclease/exonuclease/phosphatase family protein [Kibdelosporangium philippinense]MCE7002929.1 endonuclease/exonuclease/phosphatase family protein [Kibdelosporangium philippinense]
MKVRVVLAVVLALVGMAPVATAATQVKVLQLNICNSGVAGCYTGRALSKAVSVITSTKPQVLSVNESCSGDVEPLRQAMGSARAAFVAAQRPDGSPVLCTNGQQYGNIVMVSESLAGSTTATGRYDAQDTSTERRVWACLPAGRISACTTHLSARSGSTAMAQCKELMAKAVTYPRPTVIAGDMNMRYQGSPNVQDCNPSGFYRKGDGSLQHIFASADLAFVSGTKIDMAGTTDHPGWLVTVNMA